MTLVMNPVARALRRASDTPPFDINSLFANSELGALYDHSDLTTLYQESTGITPVSADTNPVGLRLDKSPGMTLGAEKVVNGGFDADTDWTKGAGWTISGGVANRVSGSVAAIEQTVLSVSANTLYKIDLDISGFSGTGGITPVFAGGSSSIGPVLSGDGHKTCFIITAAANTIFRLSAGSAVNCTIDNVTVKEVAGYHSRQTTATARPLYKTSPSRIDFDGIDDLLTTTFPDLGTDVTIARSIPGTGASILTGQTIGAGTWSDSTDSCAVVIVNRALTSSETTGLTAWLNAKAGL